MTTSEQIFYSHDGEVYSFSDPWEALLNCDAHGYVDDGDIVSIRSAVFVQLLPENVITGMDIIEMIDESVFEICSNEDVLADRVTKASVKALESYIHSWMKENKLIDGFMRHVKDLPDVKLKLVGEDWIEVSDV